VASQQGLGVIAAAHARAGHGRVRAGLGRGAPLAALVAALIAIGAPASALAATVAAVNLGTAGNFVILSKAGISTTGATAITGNLGVSPIAASAITGFALVLDKSGKFSTSSLVTGKIYAANYAPPTPSQLTTAVGNMQTAYTNAAGRKNPTAINLGSGGNIGGLVIKPGLYKWTSAVTIQTNVTLSGSSNAVWIFQIAGTLDIATSAKVILAGGARPQNIFWQVSGATTLGTYSVFNGIILDQTKIAMETGAKLNGRALAQTAVTLDDNSVTAPPPPFTGAASNVAARSLHDAQGHCLAATCAALSE